MNGRRLLALTWACWSAGALAAFDPTDVIQIEATGSLVHEDNLFRLSDDADLAGRGIRSKSDIIRTLGLGLRINKPISRQRLLADLSVYDTAFDKNDNLDHRGGEGRLAWEWRVGNYWDGDLSARRRRSLGGFADIQRNIRDIVDTDTYLITGGYQFHPRWRLGAELREDEVTHSTRRTLNAEIQSVAATLTYRTPAENSIGLRFRHTEREYPNRLIAAGSTLDNAHQEQRLNTVLLWRLGGSLVADGQLGYVWVRHDQATRRDFDGVTWRLGATWDATGKLRFVLRTSRDLRLYEDLANSFVVVNSIGITPTYAVTAKIALQGDLRYEKWDYRGSSGFIEIPGVDLLTEDREDRYRRARLGISYSPHRNIDLSLSYELGRRNSTLDGRDFDYQTWLGTLRVAF